MPKEDTQFKPGQSGNPKGRPLKEYCLTDILREQGNSEDIETTDGKKISRKAAIAQKLWEMAMDGDVTAMKYVYDRIDGKPRESIDLDHRGELLYSIIPAQIPEDGDD